MSANLPRFHSIHTLLHSRTLRLLLQISISIALLAFFVRIAGQANLIENMMMLPTFSLLASITVLVASVLFGILRWKQLLSALGISESLLHLFDSYLIGIFFSLFLPTGIGGDAVRAYDIGRRHGAVAQAALATLQERLVSLGVLLGMGFIISLLVSNQLPMTLMLTFLLVQLAGMLICLVVLFPKHALAIWSRVWDCLQSRKLMQRLTKIQLVQKLTVALAPLTQIAPIRATMLLNILATTIVSSLLVIAAYAIVGWAIGVQLSFQIFCIVIPLIFVVRMLPISFGGIGVGEGVLVGLLQLFGVPSDQGLTLGLVMLALQMLFPLIGGILLLVRVLRGTWQRPHTLR